MISQFPSFFRASIIFSSLKGHRTLKLSSSYPHKLFWRLSKTLSKPYISFFLRSSINPSMEFWGVEVKPGQTTKVNPGDDKVLHLSQASLGEVKKDKNESSLLYVKVDGKKLVVGTLSAACTHITYDLVFEKEFEIFHTGKTSIYFCGYMSVLGDEPNEFSDSEFDSDEDNLLDVVENGKAEAKDEVKPKVSATKSDAKKVKIEEPKKDKKPVEDDDDDDEDEDDSDDGSDDEDMLEDQDDSDDDDDEDSDEEDEETPKKVEQGKKRPAESASKATPADKKAKLVTPQKKGTDAKKGVAHVSTPHPSKGGKTPATSDNKSKPQTPKSGGSLQCKSCTKTFGSEKGLESHSKAKHSAGK